MSPLVQGPTPPVLIVGAGAVGTMLACDLLQQGVAVRMIDRKTVLESTEPHSRAVLVWPRMLELLRRIGVVGELVAAGHRITGVSYFSKGRRLGVVPMDSLGTTPAFTLSLPQRDIERVLRARYAELGGTAELGVAVEELDHRGALPRVVLRHPDGSAETVRPQWLVGADGVGSTTRKLLGVPYPGEPFEMGISIGDFPVEGPVSTTVEYHYSRHGLLPLIPMGGGLCRLASIVPPVGDGWESFSRDDIQRLVGLRASRPYVIGEPRWTKTFQPRPGIAETFRVGRCLLAGDAAHCVVPLGGQGLNLGIQDAFNLGWKLAGVVRGRLPDSVLDSYDTERRRAAHQVTAIVAKQIAFATQRTPMRIFARDALFVSARRAGLMRNLAAPLLSGVGLTYGDRRFPLLRPPTGPARPGQRVPLVAPPDLDSGRPALDLASYTAVLWPGTRGPAEWASLAAMARRELGTHAVVHDLGVLPPAELAVLRPAFGPRPACAIVRPDGHLAARFAVTRLADAAVFLRGLTAPLPLAAVSTEAA
jgi:2-polyprenyl-6-methoxyphenol hydroxylase-like FAD-dependent oxidoreductase